MHEGVEQEHRDGWQVNSVPEEARAEVGLLGDVERHRHVVGHHVVETWPTMRCPELARSQRSAQLVGPPQLLRGEGTNVRGYALALLGVLVQVADHLAAVLAGLLVDRLVILQELLRRGAEHADQVDGLVRGLRVEPLVLGDPVHEIA
eukprot:13715922-Alexandrium_andersonii.AAC.1